MTKIIELSEAAAYRRETREAGQRVVLSHGVFDLLHVGHLRHFKIAAAMGDRYVVSLTADEHVHKGPRRPVFPVELRAEMIAGFELVDRVIIVRDPSAIPVIDALQPDVYAKGGEYRESEKDITGKIDIERAATEAHGGALRFTDEITFSSSNLLNRHLNVLPPAIRPLLDELRSEGAEELLLAAADAVREMRVLVVGETIVDEYHYVVPMAKAAKESIIATLYDSTELFAGGAVASARQVAGFCASVDVITVLGDPGVGENYEKLVRESLPEEVSLHHVTRDGAPTVRKSRFVEPAHVRKLFEVYTMDDDPLTSVRQREFEERLEALMADADVVVVNDFGHGLIADSTVSLLCEKAPFLAVNAQTNGGNLGYNLVSRYPRADYVCLDLLEARLAVRDKTADPVDLCARALPAIIDCPNIAVTTGRAGCVVRAGDGDPVHVPALTELVLDTVGAGDAFFAVTAPFVAHGVPIAQVGLLGNIVGAEAVGVVGHRESVDHVRIKKTIGTLFK